MKITIKDPLAFKELLIRNGHTQVSFSESIGINRTYLYKMLNGQSIGPGIADKICKSLDVSFDDIFFISMLTAVI